MFKSIYNGDSELVAMTRAVVTQFRAGNYYILIVQDGQGEVDELIIEEIYYGRESKISEPVEDGEDL